MRRTLFLAVIASSAIAQQTNFEVTAPAAVSGCAFDFTVTARDSSNDPFPGYAGTVHFTSSDGSAVLPADIALVNGVGTFSATLLTLGNQTITATDTTDATITGTSAAIAVSGSFVVTNTDDSGCGSLRQAILTANQDPGINTITFNIPGATPQTIFSASPMNITTPMVIDGSTQPGYAGTPVIQITGNEFNVSGDGSTIRGLALNGYGPGSAITISGSNNIVAGNYLGLRPDGVTGFSNSVGVEITGGSNNTIGGITAGDRNLIAANNLGVAVIGAAADPPNVIRGNWIGLNASGAAVPNEQGIYVSSGGVVIGGESGTTPGGACSGPCNVVSGNTEDGIIILDATDVTVVGNFIGVDPTGVTAIGNGINFPNILVYRSTNVTIGGTSPSARNIVSGAAGTGAGIAVQAAGALITGNFIGTDTSGAGSLPNHIGVHVNGSIASTIGGLSAGAGNVIVGGAGGAIALDQAYFHTIQSNFAGIASDGTTLLGLGSITLFQSGANTIGAVSAGGAGGNRIAGQLSISVSNQNRVFSNLLNAALATPIDLNDDGPSANDACDPDGDGNRTQNHPLFTTAYRDPSASIVAGTLDSAPNATYAIELYSEVGLPAGFIGPVGVSTATTPAGLCDAIFNETLPALDGDRLWATATDADGNTSEVSAPFRLLTPPDVTKMFGPPVVAELQPQSQMTIAIFNSNDTPLAGVAFIDTYPAGLQNAAAPGMSADCVGATLSSTASSLTLSGATIPTGGTCQVTVNVQAPEGEYVNDVTVTTATAGSWAVQGMLTVVAVTAPEVTQSFTPATVEIGEVSQLTITLSHAAGDALALSNVAFTDTFPAGIATAPVPAESTTCTGTLSVAAGSISLSAATLAPGASCTVTVDVTGVSAGTWPNSVTVTASNAPSSAVSTSNLTVSPLVPPVVTKLFTPAIINKSESSQLNIVITNENSLPMTSVQFFDVYPTGMSNDPDSVATTDCAAATLLASPTSNVAQLSGATIPANSSCTTTIDVRANAAGTFDNEVSVSGVVNGSALNGENATATLTVTSLLAPSITKSFAPSTIALGETSAMTITITNPNATPIETLALFDEYPEGMVGALTATSQTVCGGSVVAAPGFPGVLISDLTVPANGTCTITIDITATRPGTLTNTIPVAFVFTSNADPIPADVSATLSVDDDGCVSFAAPVQLADDGEPIGVATADFDGDGDLDLASANYDSDDVSVFLGNGDGTFATAVNYAAGTNPPAIVAADFDSDGNVDLALTTETNVSILRGNGDGTFEAPVGYTAGTAPQHLAAADLDGDGILDLAVANRDSNDIAILLGNGDGTFAAAATYPAPTTPVSVAAGDINGDSRPDLAVASIATQEVSILLNNGDGTFGTYSTIVTFAEPATSVVLADLDQDGDNDLAATHLFGEVSVLTGNGDGTFATPAAHVTGYIPTGLTTADFNADGSLDLAVVNSGGGDIAILTNQGNGTFAPATTFTTGGFQPYSIATGDFDGDGRIDFATGNIGSVAVVLNDSTCSVTLTSTPNPSVEGQPVTFTATVTGSGPTPTGSVSFFDSATSFGVGTLDGAGQATVTTSTLSPGSHPITAVYSGDANHGGSPSATLTQIVVAAGPGTADLSITKMLLSPAYLSQNGTFRITATNTGPDTADSVVVTDVLPAEMTFVSAVPSQGTCTGTSTITCSLGSLANGASATIVLIVTFNALGETSNTVSILGTPQIDPDGANSAASAQVAVQATAAIPLLSRELLMLLCAMLAIAGAWLTSRVS